MYLLNASRMRLLTVLPKGGFVAEVGVALGNFSQHIVRLTAPDILYLIDPWEKVPSALEFHESEGRRESVVKRFAHQISAGRVVVYPMISTEVAPVLANDMFSWVYIDAAHDYENVFQDLRAFAPKVAKDGFILGHDYSDNPLSRKRGFGVVKAVREFMEEDGWRMVALTQESAPSFMLTRHTNETTLPPVLRRLQRLGFPTIQEIPHELLDTFTQVEGTRKDGKFAYVVQFADSVIASVPQ